MRIRIRSWKTGGDSFDLQDDGYEAITLVGSGNGMSAAQPTYIDLGASDPILGGKTLAGTMYTFHVKLLSEEDDELASLADGLKAEFLSNDFNIYKLYGEDVDNEDKLWYLEGFTVGPPMLVDGAKLDLFTITLALKQPYWIEDELHEDTWLIESDSDTREIESLGNIPALPTFEITPIEPKASNGILHKDFYAIHTSGYGGTFGVDVTNGGLNTAALVGTGDMLASGDDVGLNINGVYVPLWVGGTGWDSAETLIWAVMKFTPFPLMTLKNAISGSGLPAEIVVDYVRTAFTTGPNGVVLINLKQNSTLQINDELFTYSTYTVDTAAKTITFIPVAREAKGSSLDSHSITDQVFWIENEVWLTYGNASAPARVNDDTKKPAFDLEDSTNSLRVWYEFGDSTGLRTEQPSLQGRIRVDSKYTLAAGGQAEPYEVIGMRMSSEYRGGVYSDPLGHVEYQFTHAGGFSNFFATGQNYRSAAYSPYAAITSRTIRYGGETYYVIPQPVSVANWEDIEIDVPMPDHSQQVYFGFDGGLPRTEPLPFAMQELDVVILDVFDPVTVTRMGAEQENYKLGGSLAHDNGYAILFLDLITKTGNTVTIDTSEQEVYSQDGKRLRGMIGFGGPRRDEWMILRNGANILTFTDLGTVSLRIVTKWRGRNTI